MGSSILCPLGWGAEGSTSKIFLLVMIPYYVKFSSSSYNGWSVEIVGMKMGHRGLPLRSGVDLTPLKLCYRAECSGSAAMLPIAE